MPVEPLLASGSTTAAGQMPGTQPAGSDGLGEMFLQLLVKELSHQDPLNPMDGTDFVTQLAQLSTLEQMRNMNSTLKTVHKMQELAHANSLIGRNIRATGPNDEEIEGIVSAVTQADDEVLLTVDGLTVPLSSVSEISSTPAEAMFNEALAGLLSEIEGETSRVVG